MRNLGGQAVNPYTPSLKLLFYSRENIFREMRLLGNYSRRLHLLTRWLHVARGAEPDAVQ